ncbi:hypothetical protein AALP_AA2G225100 [Arabis alpina]|uniref:KIB1-4 beta-propeller domain-containing protein n=1 Tax=Arabis alpina TaxID=50452 RepID=A0A087HJA3_ARAAL|nr:hypothetical protein AALP_AA2G225100 [Arabis alpina]
MSLLLLRQLLKPSLVRSSSSCFSLVRSSLVGVSSNGFSSGSSSQFPPCCIVRGSSSQFPPCCIVRGSPCEDDLLRKLVIHKANEFDTTRLEKKVPRELLDDDAIVTVGSSHGWVGTLKEDGILVLQDDLNPVASDSHPKRVHLPPLVTLPNCQTQIVTNVSMSTSSPEDENCVVAVKFLGPQLSFCRPGQSNPKWTNIRIKHQCFYSSRVMFSEKDDVFRLPGSGGHLIGSWDPKDLKDKPNIQRLRFQNLPELTKTKLELLHSCSTTEHLVESRSTGETFLIKWYRKATSSGAVKMKSRALMVFKLEGKGNALYTRDIGDLCIFLSNSEPFCVPATSFPGLFSNCVRVVDIDEGGFVFLGHDGLLSPIRARNMTYVAPYHIPPQNQNII